MVAIVRRVPALPRLGERCQGTGTLGTRQPFEFLAQPDGASGGKEYLAHRATSLWIKPTKEKSPFPWRR